MGIYIFNAKTMEESLNNDYTDFGKEVIPDTLKKFNVAAYVYDGYWEDIGTIRNFYDATLDLTSIKPKFNFYDEDAPIYTHNRNLPSSKVNMATLDQVNTKRGMRHNERDDQALGNRYPLDNRVGRVSRGRYLHGSRLLRNRLRKRGQPAQGRTAARHRRKRP